MPNTLLNCGTHIFWVMGDGNRVMGDGNWKSKQPLNLKNRMFTSLVTSSLSFPPYTPHYAMWHKPLQSYIAMSTKPTLPWIKHLNGLLQHILMDSKQAKQHCPQLIRNRIMKKEMIHWFSTRLHIQHQSIIIILLF